VHLGPHGYVCCAESARCDHSRTWAGGQPVFAAARGGGRRSTQTLQVTTVITGLNQPTSMVFLSPGEFLVLEKATGKVQHVINGAVAGTALDLPVNSASERGLLGIALQPDFAQSPGRTSGLLPMTLQALTVAST
jgi:glucose/arabinose dehydrogenase